MVSDQEKSFLKSAVLNKFVSQDQAKRLFEELQRLAATGAFKGAGDLAIEKGFMTQKQVKAIHAAMERGRVQKQNVEFGQAALSLGLVTQTQLAECSKILAAQSKETPPGTLGDVMMSKNYITMEQHERIMSQIEEPAPTLRDPKPTQRLGVCTACDKPITGIPARPAALRTIRNAG
jgi:hypothetical protein